MLKIIKSSYPYYVLQDTTKIEQYCVVVMASNFAQQISPWYFRKGNAINKYNKILQDRTNKILNHNSL